MAGLLSGDDLNRVMGRAGLGPMSVSNSREGGESVQRVDERLKGRSNASRMEGRTWLLSEVQQLIQCRKLAQRFPCFVVRAGCLAVER